MDKYNINNVSKHLTDTIMKGNNLINIYSSLSNKSINKLVINTAFLAGIIWSQNDPSNFIFYPMSSMFMGIIYGGITSVTSRIIIKFLPNNFKPFFAGLIGLSSGVYIMSQFYKKLTNQLEDDYIIYSIVRERNNYQIKDQVKEKIEDTVAEKIEDSVPDTVLDTLPEKVPENKKNDINTDDEIEINTKKTINEEINVDTQESIEETNKNIDEYIFDGKYEFDFSIS